jgi:hypothetical protein
LLTDLGLNLFAFSTEAQELGSLAHLRLKVECRLVPIAFTSIT